MPLAGAGPKDRRLVASLVADRRLHAQFAKFAEEQVSSRPPSTAVSTSSW